MTDQECLEKAREHMLTMLQRIPAEATATQLDAACRVLDSLIAVTSALRVSRTFAAADKESVH